LEGLGLLEYRKSGRWITSDAGHRLLGAGDVSAFKSLLQARIDLTLEREKLTNRPRGLTAAQRRQSEYARRSAEYLARINAHNEAEPTL
jgi:hypothetical protein